MSKYNRELAIVVKTLFDEGVFDPDAIEILQRYTGRDAHGLETLKGVRRRLPQIRDWLERDFKIQAYLVNPNYYESREIPATLAEALKLIPASPHGGYKRSAGIRKLNGGRDTLWEATRRQGIRAGAGTLKAQFQRALNATEDACFSKGRAADMVESAYRRTRPGGLTKEQQQILFPKES